MSAQIIAFRSPGSPVPRDPPVYVPVRLPQTAPRLSPAKRFEAARLLQEFASGMGLRIVGFEPAQGRK